MAEAFGTTRLAGEPAVVVARLEDDGHAVVHLGGEFVGLGGDDGEGEKPLACAWIFPGVPEAGEGEGLAVVERVEEGLPGSWRRSSATRRSRLRARGSGASERGRATWRAAGWSRP